MDLVVSVSCVSCQTHIHTHANNKGSLNTGFNLEYWCVGYGTGATSLYGYTSHILLPNGEAFGKGTRARETTFNIEQNKFKWSML